MKLLADERVEVQTVEELRRQGHDILSIEEGAQGISDEWVLATATSEHRILLTADKDFGELVHRLGRATAGVVLLRLTGLSNANKATTVAAAIQPHQDELSRAFTVIEPTRVRIRGS